MTDTSCQEHGWAMVDEIKAMAAMICQDLPKAQGEALVRSFAKHSALSFGNELTHAGYQDIPTSYLLCELDLAGPPYFQREMIAMIEEASGGREGDITSIEASHFSRMSKEKEKN